jgi:hypothetical protein
VAVVADHLFKVGRSESQDSDRPEDAPTLAEERECLPTAQVLDHMRAVGKLPARFGRGDPLGHVCADCSRREATSLLLGQETHPPQRPSEPRRSAEENRRRPVDLDPAGDDIHAAPRCNLRPGTTEISCSSRRSMFQATELTGLDNDYLLARPAGFLGFSAAAVGTSRASSWDRRDSA